MQCSHNSPFLTHAQSLACIPQPAEILRNSSAFLYSLEQQLAQEYNTDLHQEYLYWQLKSQITWLNYGDGNTKYFPLKTVQQCSHLQVATLKDDMGLWLTGEPLTQHINNVFKK